MGNVERADKTLPTNEMVFYVRRDAKLRARWKEDKETVCREFGCSPEEINALSEMNPRTLLDLGVH